MSTFDALESFVLHIVQVHLTLVVKCFITVATKNYTFWFMGEHDVFVEESFIGVLNIAHQTHSGPGVVEMKLLMKSKAVEQFNK